MLDQDGDDTQLLNYYQGLDFLINLIVSFFPYSLKMHISVFHAKVAQMMIAINIGEILCISVFLFERRANLQSDELLSHLEVATSYRVIFAPCSDL
uniref:AlNc14C234G9354 protein n=1 Tax=Albugo laibachii Nc14 TaxID=890382 RepID=F0WSL0_9STRA|nr:AlNc14C234G9354 [Albugo laibachii Nc14]|eukprot:CCA24336.1 AlNc14C234G9354 [Albugo laibachii Nc14]